MGYVTSIQSKKSWTVKLFAVLVVSFAFLGCLTQDSPDSQDAFSQEIQGFEVEWLGHSGFKVSAGGKNVYFDPVPLPDKIQQDADVVFITHGHYDHCDASAVSKISKRGTLIVTVQKCAEKFGEGNVRIVSDGEKFEVDGLKVDVVSAYNVVGERLQYHSKGEGVGFVVGISGNKVYHAGDTDFVVEMQNLGDLDLAFLPAGGTFTMNYSQAAFAANAIKPKTVVPMHYNFAGGKQIDITDFKALVAGGVEVKLLQPSSGQT